MLVQNPNGKPYELGFSCQGLILFDAMRIRQKGYFVQPRPWQSTPETLTRFGVK